MKRTFIAIDIPASAAIKECIEKFSEVLKNEKIKWLEPDNLHLTLKFLGETKESLLQTMNDILAGITVSQPVFDICIVNSGVFKNLANPTVIWLGVEMNPGLKTLHSAIDSQMENLGFRPESREFSPHITIGRVRLLKEKSKLQQLLQEYNSKVFLQFKARELVFYESVFLNNGSKYVSLGRHELNNANR